MAQRRMRGGSARSRRGIVSISSEKFGYRTLALQLDPDSLGQALPQGYVPARSRLRTPQPKPSTAAPSAVRHSRTPTRRLFNGIAPIGDEEVP